MRTDFPFLQPRSIYLSKHENHRTEMDLKNAMILKLFAVKLGKTWVPGQEKSRFLHEPQVIPSDNLT